MRVLLAVCTLGFTSYCLTLAALPALAVRGGADESLVGLVTAVLLLATVAAQSAVPAAVARVGIGPVLAVGLVALGLPAPLYAVGDGLGWICAVSAVRGLGFGVLTVLGALLAAAVAPADRRGEGIGLFGLAVGLPNLVAVPAGVALVLTGHVGWWAWLAAVPLLALPLLPALLRAVPGPLVTPGGGGRGAVGAVLGPAAVLFVITLASGGLFTVLPVQRPDGPVVTVALLAAGIAAALSRWRVGVLADRIGQRVLLPGSLLVGAAGMVLLGLGLAGSGSVPRLMAGAVLFGVSYGAVQNLTLLAAFDRAGPAGATTASALWNAAFDAGTGVGALALGAVVAGVGTGWTFGAVAAGLVLAPLLTVRPRTPR